MEQALLKAKELFINSRGTPPILIFDEVDTDNLTYEELERLHRYVKRIISLKPPLGKAIEINKDKIMVNGNFGKSRERYKSYNGCFLGKVGIVKK